MRGPVRAGPEFLGPGAKLKFGALYILHDVDSTICKYIYNVTNKYLIVYKKAISI